MREPRHCDDYIDDPAAPDALRLFLARARSPGHGMLSTDPYPTLYADYGGRRVRVVMASRLGNVGITTRLRDEEGYEKRVMLDELTNFGDAP